MRVFLYSAIGIPLLIADAVLLWALPARMATRFTTTQGLILLFGAVAYLCLHFLLRKPERMYLWAHEFTHLLWRNSSCGTSTVSTSPRAPGERS